MARWRTVSRLVPRAVGLGALVGVLAFGAFVGPAGAEVLPVPNAGPLPPNAWIAFGVSSPASFGAPATISVIGSGGGANVSQVWPPLGTWPTSWSGGGLTFTRAGLCVGGSECQYSVSGATGPHHAGLVFGAGAVPPNFEGTPGGPPPPDLVFPPPPTTEPPTTVPPTTVPPITVPPTTVPPTTVPPITVPPVLPPPDPTFTGPPNGVLSNAAGFQFRVANPQLGVTYDWVLMSNGKSIDEAKALTYTPPASIFSTPGHYTLSLTASDVAGIQKKTFGVDFEVVPSRAPAPNPPSSPTPTPPAAATAATSGAASTASGGTHSTTARSFTQFSFPRPLPNFATPTPGAVQQQQVTVIWLWRPDWFQANRVKTSGRPTAVKRAAVSVNRPARTGPSAAPWLAGLAAFGIFGTGWMLVRRRRVRLSLLD